jgi:hypothetical protein
MMKANHRITRRDFLKLSTLLPLAWFARPLADLSSPTSSGKMPHVIIMVYDAWSADDVSLYGYPRHTMPNLERFAKRANVYHKHNSAGTFTITGTASLLTGLYPWSHRALDLGSGIITKHIPHQVFAALQPTHSTVGYAQNHLADRFICQAIDFVEQHVPSGSFNLQRRFIYDLPIFEKDGEVAMSSFEDNIIKDGKGYDASLFLGPLFRTFMLHERLKVSGVVSNYPNGLPDCGELFLFEDVVDGAIQTLKSLDQPSLVYMHFFPPHGPYRFTSRFMKEFETGWKPKVKPIHPLAPGKKGDGSIRRRFYDEAIASWDDETGRLYDYMEETGLLDNSYVVITADHGEIFERGEFGHDTPLIFDPLMHVPLVISSPGQNQRKDIKVNTSAVDVLPTLAHLTGNPIPDWVEGQLLPGLGGQEMADRSVYTMDAKRNPAPARWKQFSLSMSKGHYRLTYYKYSSYKQYEFYDLADDPEELNDLYPSKPTAALQMQAEMMDKLAEMNQPLG